MQPRFAPVTAAILVAALGQGTTSASHAPQPRPSMEVLVDGTPQPHYEARGQWYVEALKGQEYAIRLRNPYPTRVAVALSVDGLNTIDARDTTAAEARKWVLAPYETVTIRGWQTSMTAARRFVFTSEDRSYGQALDKTNNLGVITAVFFRERTPEPPPSVSRALPEAPPAATSASASGDASGKRADARARVQPSPRAAPAAADEYAATGLGQRTSHTVQQVWIDLEDTPAVSLNIRYEFRPQLVRLGILPGHPEVDPLARRERARGFEPGFCPDPKR